MPIVQQRAPTSTEDVKRVRTRGSHLTEPLQMTAIAGSTRLSIRRIVRRQSSVLVLLAGLLHAQPLRAQTTSATQVKQGAASFIVAIVDGEMQARPVPLHALRVIGAQNDTTFARTGLDGKAVAQLAAGTYRVESVAPVTLLSKEHRWSIAFSVKSADTVTVTLTNDNATIASAVISVSATDRLDASAALFSRFAKSVFRIEAGLGHGSGFLADTLGGVIITNAHVVEGVAEDRIYVVTDSVTRVRAELLSRDAEADIAVLRVHPSILEGRTRIELAAPVGAAPVVPGERLAAMGYPLNQSLTVTSGIASSIRAGAIISDVNINHGNSGGPLLNLDGRVVAVNTFGDFTQAGGPGISGSILISRAAPALATAAAKITQSAAPDSRVLPTMPLDALDVGTLKTAASAADPRRYRSFANIGLSGFSITVQTPPQTFAAMAAFESIVARDRRKREALAGVPESQRYSEVREFRDWQEYVGNPASPVVSFSIIPEIGETGGSVLARVLLSPNLKATYKFQGDVRGAQIFRNRESVEPIRGGHAPTKVYVDNSWLSLKDVADQGFYVFDINLFRPDSAGVPPRIVIAVTDLKSPKKLKCREIPPVVVVEAWNDFATFFAEKRPTEGFRLSEIAATRGRKPASDGGFLKDECTWLW